MSASARLTAVSGCYQVDSPRGRSRQHPGVVADALEFSGDGARRSGGHQVQGFTVDGSSRVFGGEPQTPPSAVVVGARHSIPVTAMEEGHLPVGQNGVRHLGKFRAYVLTIIEIPLIVRVPCFLGGHCDDGVAPWGVPGGGSDPTKSGAAEPIRVYTSVTRHHLRGHLRTEPPQRVSSRVGRWPLGDWKGAELQLPPTLVWLLPAPGAVSIISPDLDGVQRLQAQRHLHRLIATASSVTAL